jgi:DNA-binding response OmpR family regulator
MNKKTILVIDDDVGFINVITDCLELSGYGVISAYDGLEGLKKVHLKKPDLIILDLMLPKLDGLGLCALLKKDARYAGIPVIMFTARVAEKDIVTGKRLGADAYMTKPQEPAILLDKIKGLLIE